jgi:hypothetical protein
VPRRDELISELQALRKKMQQINKRLAEKSLWSHRQEPQI